MNFVNTSLFIGDLPKFCNESDLEQLFAGYGPILDVKIKRNVNTGKTLSYGFVTLSTEALASDALRATDGAMFLGRKLRVRWAMYNARTQNPINQSIINSVYVRFVTTKIEQYVTEEDLHRVFDPFGCVLDVSIKESSIDPRSNRQSGYGFVHFTCDNMGIECAFQAVAALDNSTVEGITFNVELSKNLLKQFNSADSSTPRKEDAGLSPQKTLSSPSRSSNDLRQQFPITPSRSIELDRVPSMEISPYKSLAPECVTPLRNCASLNSIKISPNPSFKAGPESLPRTYSDRINRSMPPQPPMYQNPYPSMGQKNISRENSFRSTGLKSNNGSFRTLAARSSSQNSMSSSFGTTVSCASSPSPFTNNNVVFEQFDKQFEKVQSFRSDPGANRVYLKSNSYGQGEQLFLGQNCHSSSFHETPLSRSLFSLSNSRFGGSDISLLSVPGQVPQEFGSFHSDIKQPQRPDSRASDCSDVSTDSEGAELVISDNPHSEDFFSFLTQKNGPESKYSDQSNSFQKVGNLQSRPYDGNDLNLESLNVSNQGNPNDSIVLNVQSLTIPVHHGLAE